VEKTSKHYKRNLTYIVMILTKQGETFMA